MDWSNFIKAVPSMGALGALFAGGLAYASVKFSVKEDPKKESINESLPGIDCGACGYPGCASYADAIVNEDAKIDLCQPGGQEVKEEIAEIMGLETGGASVEKVAQLMCQGDRDATVYQADYQGIASCNAINMEESIKSCPYGCLGFGDCIEICPFDAIYMNDKGLPEVDLEACTACGKCVEECPRDIIEIVTSQQEVTAKCKSVLEGSKVSKVCENGCIACTLCEQNCPVDAITMENNLPVIDDETCIDCGKCVEVCPTDSMVELPLESPEEEEKKESTESPEDEIIITDACVGCGACETACPVDAIEKVNDDQYKIDQDKCVQCEKCIAECPVDAIEYQ
uniref:Ion-translocating oxidoreductase complex subunit B n=1 Tax=Halobacteroides sp. TB21 TaxID=1504410 RepID=A0A060DAB5_9FIRM|nr:electron transport complex protein RnfB [Halobacteroides sp. TB21]